ncbi:restriction endonuclease subunit S [soil metagenome]
MLLSNLNLLATAPGGVARLRELILTLAVQGKLVPQDASDEPARVLLQKIRAEKDRLIAAGKIKQDKPLAGIGEEEKPFRLPAGWEWVPLQHIGYTQTGTTPDKKNPDMYGDHMPFIKPGDIYPNYVDYANEALSKPGLIDSGRVAPAGSFLMVCIGTIGKSNLITTDCSFNQQINSITPLCCSPEFIKLYCRSSFFQTEAWARSSSTTISILNKGKWEAIPLALPPLAEQSRIVARVEELMRLCDALEAKGQLEAAQHAQLVSALLGTLADSDTPEALAKNWQRIARHFDLLLDRPQAVDALEQTILQLAVRGLLVPQDPSDEPASALLQKIRAEKDRLIAEGKIKRDKPLPPVVEDEKPFALPQGWEWARFGDVALISSGITLGRKTAIPSPVFLPYLRVANVQRWHLNLTSIKEVVIDQTELERFQLSNGDLLITEGGDWDKVGRTAIWRDQLPTCLHQNHVFKARGTSSDWNPIWAEMYLNSMIARTYFASSAKQTTNLASINMTQLKNCMFPLPPLAEQARIVSRVETLRRLCADLRQRLSASQGTQAQLAEALVAQPNDG